MNRRKDELIPIEIDLLAAAMELRRRGVRQFHGFFIGKTMEEAGKPHSLIGHGTLYKALARLEERSYLTSRWEGSKPADRDRGPRRRLYEVTAAGQRALAAAPVRTSETAGARAVSRLVNRPAPSS